MSAQIKMTFQPIGSIRISTSFKHFEKDEFYGIGEGDFDAEVKFQGKITRIKLTNVMHVPG